MLFAFNNITLSMNLLCGRLFAEMEGPSDGVIEVCTVQEQDLDKSASADDIHKSHAMIDEDVRTPKLGMTFGSIEEAHNFYKTYAYHTGFGVTKRSKYTFHGVVNRVKFACSKEGKPKVRLNNCKSRMKPISKIECKAMIVIIDRNLQNCWQIEILELEHNHVLDPNMVRFMPCFKSLPISARKQLEINDKTGVPLNKSINAATTQVGGYENCTVNEKDSRNHIYELRRLNRRKGDAQALMKYFHNKQAQNSNFYYSVEFDDEGRLRNMFWVDSRSRAAYQYFGDVISFDTTYLTNRYGLPFALFVGVNHHGQFILLGCGLLVNETAETYTWLFKMWLSCMGGKPPNVIITDQCKDIRGGIEEVFPSACHRFCLWRIMKKIPEKLGGYKEKEAISKSLSKAVYDSFTVAEFETYWEDMIQKYNLEDNAWLSSLYEDKELWIPVFVKDTFWAGMSSTQRSESINAFFDGFVTSKTSLSQFAEQYENALKNKYEQEAQEDFRSIHFKPQLISPLKMETQVAKIYTMNMFIKFQDEVKKMIQLGVSSFQTDGPTTSYEISDFDGERYVLYRVVYNRVENEVWCICRSFEFKGILCRHALCVLKNEQVTEIPRKYILDRWRKDFKQFHASTSTYLAPMCQKDLYDKLYMIGQQFLADIVEMGATNSTRYSHALETLKEARDKVINFVEYRGDTRNTENLPLSHDASLNGNFYMASNVDMQNVASHDTSFDNIVDPMRGHPKGQPPTNWLISKKRKGD